MYYVFLYMSPGCFWVIISEASVAGVITVDLKLAVLNRQWDF